MAFYPKMSQFVNSILQLAIFYVLNCLLMGKSSLPRRLKIHKPMNVSSPFSISIS